MLIAPWATFSRVMYKYYFVIQGYGDVPVPPGKAPGKVTSLRLPEDVLDVLQALVDSGLYKTKGEIMTTALKNLLYDLMIAIELRYLAEKKAREAGQEINSAILLQAIGQLMQERAEELSKPAPGLANLGKIVELDPEEAYSLAIKIREVLKK